MGLFDELEGIAETDRRRMSHDEVVGNLLGKINAR